MDLELLTYPEELIPDGVQPSLWLRYLKGSKALDNLYTHGQRCPCNPDGIRCLCLIPKEQICLIWVRVAELAEQIGGWTAEHVEGMG